MAYIDTYAPNAQQTIKALAGIFKSATTADLIVTANNYYAGGGTAAGLYDLLLGAYSTTAGFTDYAATSTNAAFATALITNLCAGTTITAEVQTVWATNVAAALPAFATRGAAMVALMDLINAQTTGDLATLKAVVANRAEVGAFYAQITGGTTYSSISQLTTAEALVTNDPASVTAQENALSHITYTLTTGVDAPQMTTGNDTITGAAGTLQGTDTIIDYSTTDSDVMNVTLDGTYAAAAPVIRKVEAVNLTAKYATTPVFDATNTYDSVITLINEAAPNAWTAKGDMQISDVNGTNNVSVKAGTNVSTVTITDVSNNPTIDMGAATKIEIAGLGDATTTDKATIKLVGNASDVTLDDNASGNEMHTLTLNSTTAANTVALAASTVTNTIAVTGDQNLTIKSTVTDVEAATLTGGITNGLTAGTLTVAITADNSADAADLSKIATTATIDITGGTFNASEIFTAVTGATVKVSANAGGVDAEIAGKAAGATVNLIAAKTQTTGITAKTNITTVNLSATETVDLVKFDAGTATVNVSGSKDITLGTASAAGEVKGSSALTGKLAVAMSATLTKATGGDGNDTFNTVGVAASTVVGGAGDDTIKMTGAVGPISIDGGTGSNILEVADSLDFSGQTLSITNIGALKATGTIGIDATTFASSQLTGQTLNVYNGDIIVSQMDAMSMDLSGITGDATKIVKTTVAAAVQGIAQTVVGAKGLKNTIDFNNATAKVTATGGDYADSFIGGTAGDSLVGGEGADTITGAAGVDTLTGGTGADSFVFTTAATADTITDFSVSDVDLLSISVASLTAFTDLAGTTVAGATAGLKQALSATAANAVASSTNNFMVLAGTHASAAAVEILLETGGTAAITFAAGGIADGDDIALIWADTSGNTHFSVLDVTDVGTSGAGKLDSATIADLAVLSGVDIVGTVVVGNFSFVA